MKTFKTKDGLIEIDGITYEVYDYHDLLGHFEDEMNDETIEIVGIEFCKGTALKKLDPTAFREAFNNWLSDKIDDGILEEYEDKYIKKQE